MKNFTQAILQPQEHFSRIIKNIPANMKFAFAAAVIIFAAVHGFGFLHKFLNEDSMYHFHSSLGYLYQSGRWALVGLQHIRGFYNAPWIIGLFAMAYMSIGINLATWVLGIKNRLYIVVCAILIITFPAWANQFMYDFMADAYPAAFLLATAAIAACKKWKFGFVAGGFALMLSMALYQSFLGFAIGLALIVLIRQIMEKSPTTKEILMTGLRFLICGILGAVLYYASVQVSLLITGGQLWDYQGMDGMGSLSFSQIPSSIVAAYTGFFQGFVPAEGVVINNLAVSNGLFVLYVIAFLLTMYLVVRSLFADVYKDTFNIARTLILVVLLALLPLGLNIVVVLAPDAWHHTLVKNPFVLALILPLTLLDIASGKKEKSAAPHFYIKAAVIAVAILISGNYLRQTSSFYFVQHIQYERTAHFYNRLLMRIESHAGYEVGMPVAVIGTAPFPHIGQSDALSAESWQIVGLHAERPAIGLSEWQKGVNFIQNYLGVAITPATREQTAAIQETAEFWQMPLYPRDGSLQIINGVLVVRLN